MTAIDPFPFRITGDSHADLDRMEAACQPAAAPRSPGDEARARDREEVRALIDAAARLFGVGAVELLARTYERVAVAGWELERTAATQASTIAAVRSQLLDTMQEREHARDVACALEAELALMRDPWVGRYLEQLEAAVDVETRDLIVAAVNADVEANPPAPEPAPDALLLLDSPGLPVVDDATLDEGQVIFRRGDTTIAVGHLDRLFGPLDTATEIALGAATEAAPLDAAHPLDEGTS